MFILVFYLHYSCVHAFGINSIERTQDHGVDLVVSWALVRKHQNLHRSWRLTTDANQAAGHGANRCVLLQETVLLTNRQESRALCIILHALNIWCSWQVLYSFFPNIASEIVPERAAFLTLSSPLLLLCGTLLLLLWYIVLTCRFFFGKVSSCIVCCCCFVCSSCISIV